LGEVKKREVPKGLLFVKEDCQDPGGRL